MSHKLARNYRYIYSTCPQHHLELNDKRTVVRRAQCEGLLKDGTRCPKRFEEVHCGDLQLRVVLCAVHRKGMSPKDLQEMFELRREFQELLRAHTQEAGYANKSGSSEAGS